MKKIFLLILAGCIGGVISLGLFKMFSNVQSAPTVIETPKAKVSYASSSYTPSAQLEDFTFAAQKTVDGVVHVKTEVEVQNAYNPWADFFGGQAYMEPYVQSGSGSGVIISNDGYIITNNHVIDGADKIEVSLNDNRTYKAELVGTDPATDIAVLKIEGNGFPAILIGNSDNVQIGEWVLAVGNPFDLTSTVTAGIVSAKARNIDLLDGDPFKEIFPVESFIQTDAAVNPGNSGGALVNTKGELVGINTAIASRTGSFAGYSFAVPSSIASKVAEDLITYGKVQRAFIGVRIEPVTSELALDLDLDEIKGIYVNSLTENGGAAKAGIKNGDIILEVNGREVNSVPALQEEVSKYRPGDKVEVTVLSGKKIKTLDVELRDNEGKTEISTPEEIDMTSILGAQIIDVPENVASKLGLRGGAQVYELDKGKLSLNGIKKGFIITKIDGDAVLGKESFEELISKKSGGVLLEGVYENGTKAYYGFGI